MFGGLHYVSGQINRLIDRIRLIPEVMFEIRQLHFFNFLSEGICTHYPHM